jgi:hypothetical protein
MLPFLIIFVVCIAGWLGASLWAVLAGICALTLYSLTAHRWMHVGVSDPIVVASSVLNATGACGAAYVWGWALRWMAGSPF